MKSIYLTGFVGSVKTTVGRLLGEKLNLPVIDTDEHIEKVLNKSIREIFEMEGEEQFRQYEHHFLKLLPTENSIIITDGGIILKKENRQWMSSNGIVIYLHCDPEAIVKRLEEDTMRPLLDGDKRSKIMTIFTERLHYYNGTHYKINMAEKNPNEIVNEIQKLIKKNSWGNTGDSN